MASLVNTSEDRMIPNLYEGRIEPNWYCRAWRSAAAAYCRQRAGRGTDHKGLGRCRRHDGRPIITGTRSKVHHERLGPLIDHYQSMPPEQALDVFPELGVARAILYDYIDRFEPLADAHLAWHADYQQRQRPLDQAKLLLLETLLDEYEDCRTEKGGKPLEGEAEERLQAARSFIAFLGTPPDVVKPRKILDITVLQGLIDTISKIITRWHQSASINSIPRRRYLDIMGEIGRAMNEEVTDMADLERLRRRIREIRL